MISVYYVFDTPYSDVIVVVLSFLQDIVSSAVSSQDAYGSLAEKCLAYIIYSIIITYIHIYVANRINK